MKESKPQLESANGAEVEVSTSPPADSDNEMPLTPAMNRLLELNEEMERERETAVRQIIEEQTRLTEVYKAKMAKLNALLAKMAPGLVAPPAPPAPPAALSIPVDIPSRTRSRIVALTSSPVAAGRTGDSVKWNAQKFCPFCQIQGHDGRAHRGQTVPKKWLKRELAVFGYLAPADQPQLPANYDQIQVMVPQFSRP